MRALNYHFAKMQNEGEYCSIVFLFTPEVVPKAQDDIITSSGEHGPKYWEKVCVPGRQG